MFNRASSRSRSQARQAAQILNRQPAEVADEEVRILISTVQDLVEQLGTAADPELTRLRKQTEVALERARAAIVESGAQMHGQVSELAKRSEAYVREYPWTSLGLAALCVLAVGLWTGRTVMSD